MLEEVQKVTQDLAVADRLARLTAKALEVWVAEADALQFLSTPHVMLNNQSPQEAALTEQGAQRVEMILNNIMYSLPY